MNEYSKLKDYLNGIGSTGIAITQGIVKSVSGNLCEVEIGNIVIPDVRLRASELDDDGEMLVTPKVGNGGKLGGLINIEQLTEKINDLVDTFNSHTHQVTVSHPGGTFKTVKPGSSASSFKKGDYEDEKIKH